MAHKTCWITVENARKIVVPLVLMNRHINQSRCERYITSVEFYVSYISKALFRCVLVYQSQSEKYLRTNFRYIKVQHYKPMVLPRYRVGMSKTVC